MQRYADDLRRAARELSVQSQQLTSVEEAAKESRKESTRRAKELQSLKDKVASLTASVETLTKERDTARDEARNLLARLATLSTELAKSDARREILEKEVAAASLVRLELLSKLRTDENERISALNSLRHPAAAKLPAFLHGSPGVPIVTSERALSPMSVAKSPSESMLLSLHPDLNVSDDDDDEFDFKKADRAARELEQRMQRNFHEQGSLDMQSNSAVKIRRTLEVPVVELGKPAIAVAEGVQAELSRSPQDPLHQITAAPNADQHRKAKTARGLPSSQHDVHSAAHASPDAVMTGGRADEVLGSSDAATTSQEIRNIVGKVSTSSQLTDTIALVEMTGTGEMRRPKPPPMNQLTEPMLLGTGSVGELADSSPVSVETEIDASHALRASTRDTSMNPPEERTNPAGTPSRSDTVKVVDTSNTLADALTQHPRRAFSTSGSVAFCGLEDGDARTRRAHHPSHGEVLAARRDANFRRRGLSLDFDAGPLSLSRAPWVDTLSPLLQEGDDNLSIASVLRPGVAEYSASIIPMTIANSLVSSRDSAGVNCEKNP